MAPSARPLLPDDPTLLPSDDEDEDFVPGGPDHDSDSDSDDSDQDDDQRPAKKQRGNEQEPVLTKAAVDDLWASFNALEDDPYASPAAAAPASSVAPPTSSASLPKKTPSVIPPPLPKKLVKILVTYEFAGEKITQEKQVAHDSPEAVAYFASRPATAQAVPASSSASTAASASLDALFGPDEPAPASVSKSASPAPVPQPPPAPPKPSGGGAPVRRKAGGGGLAAMSASLAKPPKLNTLEKSKMDWNQFVDKEELKDDLEIARKGGYLEKQDFLKRTEDKRDEQWEKSKSRRR